MGSTCNHIIVHPLVHVNGKGGKITTDYEKKVKHALIDRGMTQRQLCVLVNEITGLKVDGKYMSKILTGQRHPIKVLTAIKEILGVDFD